ncbi:MAG: lipopolysaccharide heptosyltransferase II, partial [Elusimicrobiota bacterium]
YRDASKKYLWIHCASVGEVNTAELFIKNLKKTLPDYNIVVSVMTSGGFKTAQSLNLPVENIFFIPLDFSIFVKKAFNKIKPSTILLVEAEFWPNLIRYAGKNRVRVFLINTRFSPKSEKFRELFPHFSWKILGCIELFLTRGKKDVNWLRTSGIQPEKIFVTGNMKYDAVLMRRDFRNVTKTDFGFSEKDKIFVAGSIREGEEEHIIDAYCIARESINDLKMIIVPRHLLRAKIIERHLSDKKLKWERYSKLDTGSIRHPDCVIVDVFGKLMDAYAIADCVFVGGGLLPLGGQNIIEPALLSKPVIFGPYMESFLEPAEILKKSGSGIEIRNSAELAKKIIELAGNPELSKKLGVWARSSMVSLAGATEKNIKIIKEKLSGYPVKILLIQPGRIGDIIFSLPFVSNLRKIYPQAHISWLIDERFESLLDGNTDIVEKIVFPYKKLTPLKPLFTLNQIGKLREALIERKFDLSIDLHGLAKSAFIVALSGARQKIASSSTYGMKEFSWLFSKEIPARSEEEHTIERHLEVIKYLIKNDSHTVKLQELSFSFQLPDDRNSADYVDEALSNAGVNASKKFVAVLTGGGWKSRRWYPERFSRVCDMIITKCYSEVLFIGGQPSGSPEAGIIENIISMMKGKAHNLSGKLNLKQLVSFLRKCSLYFGNETGPMHIACALGVPVVAIIGPTNPKRTGPFGKNYKVIKKEVECSPCKERNCKKMLCMDTVSEEEVFEQVRKILL